MIWYFLFGFIGNILILKNLQGYVDVGDIMFSVLCGFVWPILLVLALIAGFDDSDLFNKKIF
jgi:hypothetical protein